MLKCRFHKSVQSGAVGHKVVIVNVGHGGRNQVYSVGTVGTAKYHGRYRDIAIKNNNNNRVIEYVSEQSFRNL